MFSINQDNLTANYMKNILEERIKAYSENPLLAEKRKSKEYNKKWNEAVEFFRIQINKDNKKAKKPEVPFMAVRMKLLALKELDDLRWFYLQCIKYSNTYQKERINGYPVRNTFSKCFYGSLKFK